MPSKDIQDYLIKRAIYLLSPMGKRPSMFAHHKGEFIHEVVDILLMAKENFHTLNFLKKHLTTQGCSIDGFDEEVTDEWGQQVIQSALTELNNE